MRNVLKLTIIVLVVWALALATQWASSWFGADLSIWQALFINFLVGILTANSVEAS